MALITVLLMAVGLAMDAFAVSISNGIYYEKITKKQALFIGLYFGGFQFLMSVIGWFLGENIRVYIVTINHWVAFALLGYIGGAMIYGAVQKPAEDEICPSALAHGKLLLQAVATSIDALAVGIGLAFIDLNVFLSATIIGIVAFCFSILGVVLGKKLGLLFKKRAEIVGGLLLIGIGIKILLEHLLESPGI